VTIFISNSSSSPGDGLRIGTVPSPALGSGASVTVTVSITVPAGHTPDVYFLSAIADVLGVVMEGTDANNGLTAPAQVEIVFYR